MEDSVTCSLDYMGLLFAWVYCFNPVWNTLTDKQALAPCMLTVALSREACIFVCQGVLIYVTLITGGWLPCWQDWARGACCVFTWHEMAVNIFFLFFFWLLLHLMFVLVWKTWLLSWELMLLDFQHVGGCLCLSGGWLCISNWRECLFWWLAQ